MWRDGHAIWSTTALQARAHRVDECRASLAQICQEGDSVRRQQIYRAVCANPTIRERKVLCTANEPFSFFEGSGLINQWWAIVGSMRTWIFERNFQIPPPYFDDDEHSERRRRTGVPKRVVRRSQEAEAIVPPIRNAA